MNIELEEIIVNDTTIEVSGYMYATNEDWANGNITNFEWCLDIEREYNHDEHCKGCNIEFDELGMIVDGIHLIHLVINDDYNKIVNDIQAKLVTN